jgi:hypothetical protein
MKSMTRQQIAECAGVTPKTLKKWMQPYMAELTAMGMPTGKGLLPPNVIRWLADKYCIDVDP